MNAQIRSSNALQITFYRPVEIMDPYVPARKELLPEGAHRAHRVHIARAGREGVPWFLFPAHENKGLSLVGLKELRKRLLADVEQNTADGWEEYFDDEK